MREAGDRRGERGKRKWRGDRGEKRGEERGHDRKE